LKRKPAVIALISLLIVILSPGIPTPITHIAQPAHALLTGLVCIANETSTSCPETPPILTGGIPGKQVRIGIFIQNSDAILGFDIDLLTDSTILKPANIDKSLSVIPSGGSTVSVDCIGGGFGTHNINCAPFDSQNTLHFGYIAQARTAQPTTGLLFTAIYNITGTSANTPINFLSGCGAITSQPPLCVSITNGTPQLDLETTQTGGFSNQPYYAIDASPATLKADLGTTNSSTITLTTLNGFHGNLSLTTTISAPGPVPMVSPNSVVINQTFTQGFAFLDISVGPTVSPGKYNVTVTATNSSLPANSVVVHLLVASPDFTIATQSSVTINATRSATVTIALTSLHTFSGVISLTMMVSTGATASLDFNQRLLKSGGSNSSILTLSAPVGGSYNINITGTHNQLSHATLVQLVVSDFGIKTSQSLLAIQQGSTQVFKFTASNHPTGTQCCFHGDVTLSTSVTPSQGLGASCGPASILFNSAIDSTPDYTCTFTGSNSGNYTVIVGAIGLGGALFHASALVVQVLGPDFQVSASPSLQTIPQGSSASVIMKVNRVSTFNGTVTLSAAVVPSGPTLLFNTTSINLDATTKTATVSLTLTALSTTPPGTYTVTISGTATISGVVKTHSPLVTIIVSRPTSVHDVAIFSVSATPTSPTIGDKVAYTVTVIDPGDFNETVTVAALVGQTTVDQKNVTVLARGNVTLTLTWDTSTYTLGSYVVGAKVLSVQGQTNANNNILMSTAPVTLNSQSQGVFSASNLPVIIATLALIGAAIIIVALTLFFRSRRRATSQN